MFVDVRKGLKENNILSPISFYYLQVFNKMHFTTKLCIILTRSQREMGENKLICGSKSFIPSHPASSQHIPLVTYYITSCTLGGDVGVGYDIAVPVPVPGIMPAAYLLCCR